MTDAAPIPELPQTQLDEVRRARLASSRPRLGHPLSALSAICVGVGIALVAQGRPGWAHLSFLGAGVGRMATAHALAGVARRRRGMFGHRGRTRTENTTLLICAVALVFAGFPGGRELSLIFIGLGGLSAAAWYQMLRGVLVADGQRCA